MSRKLMIALFALVFLIGLSILLYPTVADYYNSMRQSRAVEDYFRAVDNLTEEDYTELFEAAREYNEKLRENPDRFRMSDEENAHYRSLLNPNGRGAIGTLEIDAIDIHLAIYHGTDEGVLQIALGHLEGSSLPVGGLGTHSVISGHRGLPTSTLLTNLDRMVLGDTFRINVLKETLTYKVDNIMIVEPYETAALVIVEDADYCTLVTCTPIGINTHRLLVRGHRTANEETEVHRPVQRPSGARVLAGARAALLLLVPATTVILVRLFIRLRRVYKR